MKAFHALCPVAVSPKSLDVTTESANLWQVTLCWRLSSKNDFILMNLQVAGVFHQLSGLKVILIHLVIQTASFSYLYI